MANPIDNGPRFNGQIPGTTRPAGGKPGTPPARVEEKGPALDAGVESEKLQLVKERIDNTPEVDMARVEAIKQSIAEGNYPLDPERIAEKFMQLEGLLNQ